MKLCFAVSWAWDVPCLVNSYFAKTDRPHSRDISSVPFFNRFPSFSLWLNTIPNLFHHQLPSSHLTVSHTTISITNSTDEARFCLCNFTRCNENIGLLHFCGLLQVMLVKTSAENLPLPQTVQHVHLLPNGNATSKDGEKAAVQIQLPPPPPSPNPSNSKNQG